MNEKMDQVNCLSLSPDETCISLITNHYQDPYYQKFYEMINFWIENDLSIFSEINFNRVNQSAIDEYPLFSEKI